MQRKQKDDVPAPRQIWEHYGTGNRLLIINIANNTALCALMDGAKVGPKRVVVPLNKFKFWGNRGMFLDGKRNGKLPTPGKDSGVFNTRNVNLGAR